MLRSITCALAAAAALVAADPASAKLYRCEMPGGGTVYTDNPSTCPGSEPHEPRGAVQAVTTSTAAPPRAQPATAPAALEERAAEAAEARWRTKKSRTQAELQAVEQEREKLRSLVTHCNRGGEIVRRDEAALKHQVSCDDARQAFAALETRSQELTSYLDGGIQEECRRAGCLPGWLR